MSYPCAYYDRDKCAESFLDHIRRALCVWNKIKRYYKKSSERVTNVKDDIVGMAIALHDFGKLAKAYSKASRYYYRHEVLSAWASYNIGKKLYPNSDLSAILGLVTLLHHETMILDAYAADLGESSVTLSRLYSVLDEFKDLLQPVYDTQFIMDMKNELNKWINNQIFVDQLSSFMNDWLNTKNSTVLTQNIKNSLKELIVKVELGDLISNHKLRAKVAAILHPVVLSDTIAAAIGRGGDSTWLYKSACGDNQRLYKAEPFNCESLRDYCNEVK